MSENNKTEEFLQKLAPCIERGDLDACVEEAARVAREMGVGAGELLELSAHMQRSGKHDFAYVLELVAVQGLEGEKKAAVYSNAGLKAESFGKLKAAEECYKKAIEINPEFAAVHYNYAILLQKQNRDDEAEKHYLKVIEINLKFTAAHNNYAILLQKQNRDDEAEKHYLKAIEIEPKLAAAHYNYAILLEKQKRIYDAEKRYLKAIGVDPKDAAAHNRYANLLRETSRFYEAEKEVRTSLQIEPEDPYAQSTLGDILADEVYLEEAKKEYQRALKNSASMKDSEISEIHNNLGRVYAQLKQYKRAKEEFIKACKRDSMNVKARRNLRVLGKAWVKPEITIIQIFLGIVLLLSLFILFELFWIKRLNSETVFATQSSFLMASLILILLYPQLAKFKAGPMEVEMSAEHRLVEAKSKLIEDFVK